MKEADVKRTVIGLLKRLEAQGKGFYINNNSGVRSYDYKGKSNVIRFGRKGSADLLWFSSGGKTIFIELKSEKGKQSQDQIDFMNMVDGFKFSYVLIQGLRNDTLEMLEKYLIQAS